MSFRNDQTISVRFINSTTTNINTKPGSIPTSSPPNWKRHKIHASERRWFATMCSNMHTAYACNSSSVKIASHQLPCVTTTAAAATTTATNTTFTFVYAAYIVSCGGHRRKKTAAFCVNVCSRNAVIASFDGWWPGLLRRCSARLEQLAIQRHSVTDTRHLQAPAEDTSFRCFPYLTHLVLNLRCAVYFCNVDWCTVFLKFFFYLTTI